MGALGSSRAGVSSSLSRRLALSGLFALLPLLLGYGTLCPGTWGLGVAYAVGCSTGAALHYFLGAGQFHSAALAA
eukprot:13952032-Alexandrium_andersonii.AAC.1